MNEKSSESPKAEPTLQKQFDDFRQTLSTQLNAFIDTTTKELKQLRGNDNPPHRKPLALQDITSRNFPGNLRRMLTEGGNTISIRYRNDGATGIHRLEWIAKESAYINGVDGAMWPDDEWTAVAGGDAETYTP